MQVVWFKRDLRISDHAPLLQASRVGPCLCLYVYEPELIQSDEFDGSHLKFINESLQDLDKRLRSLGAQLTIRNGEFVSTLEFLHRAQPIQGLWSHEETGNRITFERDKRVAAWAKKNGIPWTEIPQNGVVRRLRSRDGWSRQRDRFLATPLAGTPKKIDQPHGIDPGQIATPGELGFPTSAKQNLQAGGEKSALDTLDDFLQNRGREYSAGMSSPVSAFTACSRLSAHLAWGCVSIKQTSHRLTERQQQLREEKNSGKPVGNWLKSLRAFQSRLSWHCHFIQKLEDEPDIEFENMNRAYDGLREDEFNQNHFDAWCNGQTGYPMVDACMRALHQQSWINFRMRAMLVSFASNHLWLHWRPTAVYLARHFLDFEPGIHFSQFQMQSGTTGINTVRIYSPIKQVSDHDPTGKFIRAYVPELANIPDEYLPEPHKMSLEAQSKSGCRIGKDYPAPIVDHKLAYQTARDRLFAVRRSTRAKDESKRVMKKHGSRKGSSSRQRKSPRKNLPVQHSFDFGD